MSIHEIAVWTPLFLGLLLSLIALSSRYSSTNWRGRMIMGAGLMVMGVGALLGEYERSGSEIIGATGVAIFVCGLALNIAAGRRGAV